MAILNDLSGPRTERSVFSKLIEINWLLTLLLSVLACVGLAMQYSAANGSWSPWAGAQAARFVVALILMAGAATVDLRQWLRWAYPIYGVALVLLVIVEAHGAVGMGAQRWINLGVIQLQPSEVMKIASVLMLARYFNGLSAEDVAKPWRLIIPTILVLLPAALVMKQPDLGTAMMLVMSAAFIFFLAGVPAWMFALVVAAGAGAITGAWRFGLLRPYQMKRIATFLDPESDPLGAGYHSIQSKIAIGSGGLFGKGYMAGTQAHLSFLPERQTDFIFTMIGEELGLVGGLMLLGLVLMILVLCYAIAFRSRSHFGRLLAFGIAANFFCYVFINMAMVMGIIPVVGVPLPLVSYGGTAMLTVMFGFGLVQSVQVHRDTRIGRRGEAES